MNVENASGRDWGGGAEFRIPELFGATGGTVVLASMRKKNVAV